VAADPDDLANRALELLEEKNSDTLRQGLSIARLLDHGTQNVVLRELLKSGHRKAPWALAMCTESEDAAYQSACGLALWALREHGATLEEPAPQAARAAAVELAKTTSGKRTAEALRHAAKLFESDPDDVGIWARRLVRTLDTLAFGQDDAALRREITARCVALQSES